MSLSLLEIVGYFASIVVLCSFVMKDVKKLRLVNMAGCLLFVIYGIMMPTFRLGLPLIITNSAILMINFYYLYIAKKS
ncbi:uroporphyrinogen decarboxylase [Flavobacteriaceae bacterium]|jgi:uncharacterized protein with PQ loop repeat|nr:uroporphyrinogen decarboxylase [Flavobacteriaceae bacterium]|tara:strand:+ start:286 stop:519 length:234 start_codon:yes stop_codon:yes gene_type:complete